MKCRILIRFRFICKCKYYYCKCCLFVNVSALKIHMSAEAHNALTAFPEFVTEFRGDINVKVRFISCGINQFYAFLSCILNKMFNYLKMQTVKKNKLKV